MLQNFPKKTHVYYFTCWHGNYKYTIEYYKSERSLIIHKMLNQSTHVKKSYILLGTNYTNKIAGKIRRFFLPSIDFHALHTLYKLGV